MLEIEIMFPASSYKAGDTLMPKSDKSTPKEKKTQTKFDEYRCKNSQ